MHTLALVLYAVFFGAAFGWRTWLQWHRTGDTGLRMHADLGTLQWWAKLGFVAALVAGVVAPVAGLAGLSPVPLLDVGWLRLVGAGVAALGILATVGAQWQMGEAWRIGVDPVERTVLVTAGVFARIRNPIFTAMVIAASGFTLLVANWVAVVGLIALVSALEVQVRAVEEPYLARIHGATYDSYAAGAGRFLPGIGRIRTG
ncbi:MAG TPA: isoprenylcysteine carboxyl methyltransferase [Acidimicrobiaceae bacterium]|nr:isoprenylcysteine carboxyl methyltransferase [Acidimicrobiaceae bacterium]